MRKDATWGTYPLVAHNGAQTMARQKTQDTNSRETRSRRAGTLPPGVVPIYVDYVGAQMLFGLSRGLLEKEKSIARHPVSGKKTVFRVKDLIAFVESRRSV